jgi:PAS domain S-box-containing protein
MSTLPPQSYDTEKKLQSLSYEIFKALISSNSLRFYIKDRQHHGYKAEAMLGKTDRDLFNNQFAQEKFDDEETILQTGIAIVDKLENEVDNHGVEFWALTSKFRIEDPKSHEPYIFGFSRDKTKEVRQEKQLHEAEKNEALLRLLKGVTNEFGNQLQVIRLFLQMLPEAPRGDGRTSMLPDVLQSTAKIETLLNHLRFFTGQTTTKKECLNLNDIIRAGHFLEPAQLAETPISLKLDPELKPILFDRIQLATVITSLVENARESIPPTRAGQIWLETSQINLTNEFCQQHGGQLSPGEFIRLEVSDNGIGLDQQHVTNLFDPFYTTKYSARGIGLSVVYGIITSYRGHIQYLRRQQGGTTAQIFIPLAPPELTPALTPRPLCPKVSGRILLADDEELILNMLQRLLQEKGFVVKVASDGRQAWEIFQADPAAFDLILLDVKMPHMNGEECYRHIKAVRPDIPILFLTGGGNFVESEFFKIHERETLMKPFDLNEFLDKVFHALQPADNCRRI